MKSTITPTSRDDATTATTAAARPQPRVERAIPTNPTSKPTDGTTNSDARTNLPVSPGWIHGAAIFPMTYIPTKTTPETPARRYLGRENTSPEPYQEPEQQDINQIGRDRDPATE